MQRNVEPRAQDCSRELDPGALSASESQESMLKKAAAAQVQTDLAARVATWKQKIEPVLEEQVGVANTASSSRLPVRWIVGTPERPADVKRASRSVPFRKPGQSGRSKKRKIRVIRRGCISIVLCEGPNWTLRGHPLLKSLFTHLWRRHSVARPPASWGPLFTALCRTELLLEEAEGVWADQSIPLFEAKIEAP